MEVLQKIREELTGPGGPFALRQEKVLDQDMWVFQQRPRSLRELLSLSEAHGEKEYLVHGERRIQYAQHVAIVASVARALQERYGIEPGDRVALLAANSAEWVIAWWAVASVGGVLAAFNSQWTPNEVRYGLGHSQPKLLIADRRRLERMQGHELGVPTLEMETEFSEIERHAPGVTLPDTPITEDDPCLLLYTSGTTGRPKGALVSHRALIGFVKTQTYHGLERLVFATRTGLLPDSPPPPLPPCSLVTVPLFHLSGLYAAAIMMLAQGAKTVYRSGRFDPEAVMQTIERESVTIWSALGSSGPQLINHPALGQYDLSSVRNIGFGGAPTSPELQRRMQEAFPNARGNLGLGYGLSESGGLGTSIGGYELERRPTSVGRAALAHEIEIRDPESGLPVASGHSGEIHIRSPYLMLEYWQNPEATQETLLPGRWLATGDIGRLDDEGYLFIDSRARDMILRSGENIYPVEIEHRLDAHPGVRESAVIGIEHPELGQEVMAIVVTEPETRVDPEALRLWAGEVLARYKVPSQWTLQTDPLPRNAAGKVLKNILLERAGEEPSASTVDTAPQGEVP